MVRKGLGVGKGGMRYRKCREKEYRETTGLGTRLLKDKLEN